MNFDKISDVLKENKKTLITLAVLIACVIVISILNAIFNKTDKSINVEKTLESFAQLYYEDTYYPEINSIYGDKYMDKLKKDEMDGIKLTLRNVVNLFEDVDSENFYKEGTYCNFVLTYAMIYPKYPYSKKDYNIEVKTYCSKEL